MGGPHTPPPPGWGEAAGKVKAFILQPALSPLVPALLQRGRGGECSVSLTHRPLGSAPDPGRPRTRQSAGPCPRSPESLDLLECRRVNYFPADSRGCSPSVGEGVRLHPEQGPVLILTLMQPTRPSPTELAKRGGWLLWARGAVAGLKSLLLQGTSL